MNQSQVRQKLILSTIVAILLSSAAAVRATQEIYETAYHQMVFASLVGFLVLFATERWISKRVRFYLPVYFILQILIILFLLLVIPPFDFFAALFIPLSMQAFWLFPRRAAYVWTGLFALLASAAHIESEGWAEGGGLALTYACVLLFTAMACVMTLNAEEARAESQDLLLKLQDAHRKLQAYASQVEELSAAQERNRLARELHDSVTQTIFSMTLAAEAARILSDRDPSRVPGQLERLQFLAQSALAEMRALIQQLRPGKCQDTAAEEGLAAALRRHAAGRKAEDGLMVDLHINGEPRLPGAVAEALFRVSQEALNNIVKHAKTERASVVLSQHGEHITLVVEDQGMGFDQGRVQPFASGHMGLSSMRERVEALGGTLVIESKPGMGTRVCAEIRVEEKFTLKKEQVEG